VADLPFVVDNPYAWLTKTDVLERLRSLGHSELIAKTTSCSSVRPQTRAQPLCGCCSQCIDRRFAVLAADLAAFDPGDRYKVDLFLGVRAGGDDRTMAHDWTRSAREIATKTPSDMAIRFGAELADIAAGHPDRPASQVMSDAFQMYRRHGTAVDGVAKAALSAMSDDILGGTVPTGSLLAAILHSGVEVAREPLGDLLDDEEDDPIWEETIFPLRLVYDPNAGPHLTIKGLGSFSGAHVGLIGRLKPHLESDLAAKLRLEEHTWVPPGRLGELSKDTVRQHARRCRREFATEFEAIEGAPPQVPILVQSKPSKGYRLDPEARFVSG
jgi:hypothetical protein